MSFNKALLKPLFLKGVGFGGGGIVQNPGWLFDIGGEMLLDYMGIIVGQLVRIPVNQSGFNGMSCQGFERCSANLS